MQQAAAKHRRRGLRPSDAASSAGEVPVLLAGAALPTGGVGLVLDLTERKGAQEALEASEERFRTLARHVPGVVYLRERGGSQAFRFLSESVEELTSIAARSFYEGRATLAALIDPAHGDRMAQEINDAIARGEPFHVVYALRRGDGSQRWVEERGQAISGQGKAEYVVGVLSDITERKAAEDALRKAHDQLEQRVAERTAQLQLANEELRREQELLRHTLDQHERHRQLIAYDIHDGIAQYLTGALLRLETFAREYEEGFRVQGSGSTTAPSNPEPRTLNPPAPLDPQFEIGLALLRKCLDEARRLISGLRPPILDESGLVAAVEYLLGEQPRPAEQIAFVHDVQFQRLPPLWESNLFRIVQEALSNASKHSRATSVRIELRQEGQVLCLSVSDTGCGFAVDQAVSPSCEPSHGLHGIFQRARLLGGTAAIHSRPSEGTRIEVRVPLPQGREKALHGEQALHGCSSRGEEPADRRLIRKAPRS
jgi:PAS domain S-box-containing protein